MIQPPCPSLGDRRRSKAKQHLGVPAVVTGQESGLSSEALQLSSDSEELFSTDVSATRPGWASESDSEGFSMDVSDTRNKRRRAGG